MSSLVLLDRIKSLVKKWAKDRSLIIEEFRNDKIILREGDNIILVRPLVYEDIPDVDEINREIAVLASCRSQYNRMYVLVNQDIVSLLDGRTLKKVGIGVLVADLENDEIKEILQSPALSIKKDVEFDISKIESYIKDTVLKIIEKELENIVKTISDISFKVQKLEKVISQYEKIRQDVETLWNIVDRLKIEIERLRSMGIEAEGIKTGEVKSQVSEIETQQAQIPEYLKDNPWVRILAEKVRSE